MKSRPEVSDILSNFLGESETVLCSVESMDLVPLKQVLGNGYEQRKLHLALTNLSLIVFSDSSENSYHERYMIDEVKEGGGWKELWVYHFHILTKNGQKRKLNFKGDAKKVVLNQIIPHINRFIAGELTDQELEDFKELKSSLDSTTPPQSEIQLGHVVGQSEAVGHKARQLIKENIRSNEKVLFSLLGDFKQLIVALPTRLVVIKPGFMAGATFGARTTSFLYKDITGIEVNTGAINAVIEICTPSYQGTREKDWWSMSRDRSPAMISNCLPIRKADLKKFRPFLEQLRNMIEEAKEAGAHLRSSDPDDISSQLERLAKLYESGVLTEEEFNAAKARVLS